MTNSFAAASAYPGRPAVDAPFRSCAGIARVTVFSDPSAARESWKELEACAPASAYQTQAWLLPWLTTIGRARNIRPLVSVAYDASGEPIGLLPLGVMNRGPLRLAEFPGGKDANFTFGLFRPGISFAADELRHWLQETARQAPERIDLLALVNQPESWNGTANPLRALGGQAAPVQGYRTALERDAEAFLISRTTGEARKKMRAKERRLAAIGKVSLVTAQDADSARQILQAFGEQKARRMQEMGIRNCFADLAAEAFLEQGALDFAAQGKGGIELYAMKLDERIIATFGGATHQGRFSGMFNSFDLDPALTRNSPGELLLSWLIQTKCSAGLHTFDLGVGAARYKETWCDTQEPLFDLYVPLSAAGWALYAVKAGKRQLKRAIKDSPLAWRLVERLRKARANATKSRGPSD